MLECLPGMLACRLRTARQVVMTRQRKAASARPFTAPLQPSQRSSASIQSPRDQAQPGQGRHPPPVADLRCHSQTPCSRARCSSIGEYHIELLLDDRSEVFVDLFASEDFEDPHPKVPNDGILSVAQRHASQIAGAASVPRADPAGDPIPETEVPAPLQPTAHRRRSRLR